MMRLISIAIISIFLFACNKETSDNEHSLEAPSSKFSLNQNQLKIEIENLKMNKDCKSYFKIRDHYRYAPQGDENRNFEASDKEEVKWSRYVADKIIINCAGEAALIVANDLKSKYEDMTQETSDSYKYEMLIEAMSYYIIARERALDNLAESSAQESINEINFELWKLMRNRQLPVSKGTIAKPEGG